MTVKGLTAYHGLSVTNCDPLWENAADYKKM